MLSFPQTSCHVCLTNIDIKCICCDVSGPKAQHSAQVMAAARRVLALVVNSSDVNDPSGVMFLLYNLMSHSVQLASAGAQH